MHAIVGNSLFLLEMESTNWQWENSLGEKKNKVKNKITGVQQLDLWFKSYKKKKKTVLILTPTTFHTWNITFCSWLDLFTMLSLNEELQSKFNRTRFCLFIQTSRNTADVWTVLYLCPPHVWKTIVFDENTIRGMPNWTNTTFPECTQFSLNILSESGFCFAKLLLFITHVNRTADMLV